MNKKQMIRINESQLKQIVTESVKRVLNETKNSLLINGEYISIEMEPYFRAASKDTILDMISTWVYKTEYKDAAIELLELIKEHVHLPQNIRNDYHLDNGHEQQNDFGYGGDSYVRSQEMREPFGY